MKKLLIILSLVFICALLSAMDLDDAVTDIYSTGNLSSIGGDAPGSREAIWPRKTMPTIMWLMWPASLCISRRIGTPPPAPAGNRNQIRGIR